MSWPKSHEYFPALAQVVKALVSWSVEVEGTMAGLTRSNFIDSCLFSIMISFDEPLWSLSPTSNDARLRFKQTG